MKNSARRILTLALVGLMFPLSGISMSEAAGPANPAARKKPAPEEALTNAGIVRMVKAGVPETVIVQKIRTTKGNFDLSVKGLVDLKKAGVSETVLKTMMGEPVQESPAVSIGVAPASPDNRIYSENKTGIISGRLGAGVHMGNLVGFAPFAFFSDSSAGLAARYDVTNSIAVQGNLDFLGFGDFATYDLKAIYRFDRPLFNIPRVKTYPVAGVGYQKIQGPEEKTNIFGLEIKTKTEGGGPEVMGGLLFDLTERVGRKVHVTIEGVYAPIKVKGTTTYSYEGETYTWTTESEYSKASIGFSAIYYF